MTCNLDRRLETLILLWLDDRLVSLRDPSHAVNRECRVRFHADETVGIP